MTFYGKMQGIATGLLTKYGQGTVTMTKVTQTNASDPWIVGSASEVSETLQATVRRVEQKYVDGTVIVGTEDQIVFAVPQIAPDMTCKFSIDGVERVLVDIRPLPAAGTPVAYIAFVKS